ncbi:MAG TPA: hypothetical protein VKB84_07715 [Candidatus Binataceae bacterium]|nr:hypothetical protein [Candidatus Binataceae bacterium]
MNRDVEAEAAIRASLKRVKQVDSAVEPDSPFGARKPQGHVAAFIRAYYARKAGDLTVVLPENPKAYARRMRKLAKEVVIERESGTDLAPPVANPEKDA